jgi:hypothetical protein
LFITINDLFEYLQKGFKTGTTTNRSEQPRGLEINPKIVIPATIID